VWQFQETLQPLLFGVTEKLDALAAHDNTDGDHHNVHQLVPPVVPPGILQLREVLGNRCLALLLFHETASYVRECLTIQH
jgi:hypothetical protein